MSGSLAELDEGIADNARSSSGYTTIGARRRPRTSSPAKSPRSHQLVARLHGPRTDREAESIAIGGYPSFEVSRNGVHNFALRWASDRYSCGL